MCKDSVDKKFINEETEQAWIDAEPINLSKYSSASSSSESLGARFR